MDTPRESLPPWHQGFLRHAAWSAPCALATFTVVFRMYHTHSKLFGFLLWNLFLAWLPFAFASAVAQLEARNPTTRPALRRILQFTLALAWLLFFPNASYLVTDLIHLRVRAAMPFWYDAAMLLSLAWAGLALGAKSLRTMSDWVEAHGGLRLKALFLPTVLLLSGIGIYMGRFLRWNSWDLFTQPWTLCFTTLNALLNPFAHLRAVSISLLYTSLGALAYLLLGQSRSATHAARRALQGRDGSVPST